MSITDKRAKTASAQGKAMRSKTVIQAVGDWLFRGNRVYMLSAPNRMLKTVRINWDRETSDVEDEDGNVFYGVAWDSLEFWDDVECNFPDERN